MVAEGQPLGNCSSPLSVTLVVEPATKGVALPASGYYWEDQSRRVGLVVEDGVRDCNPRGGVRR